MIEQATGAISGVLPPKSVQRIAPDKQENAEQQKPAYAAKPEVEIEAKRSLVPVDREAAAETIAKAMDDDFPSGAALDIEVNEDADVVVYKAVDPNTGEVLKQYPSAEVIERLERLAKSKGLAYDNMV